MTFFARAWPWLIVTLGVASVAVTSIHAQPGPQRGSTSYMAVDNIEPLSAVMARMKAAQPAVQRRQADLLAERYDLANTPAQGVTMTRGKPVQGGVRVKPPAGTTWDQLAGLTPAQIRDRDLFPKGFLPLPHPNNPEGGMLFPKFAIE